jgi:hypothetical protein
MSWKPAPPEDEQIRSFTKSSLYFHLNEFIRGKSVPLLMNKVWTTTKVRQIIFIGQSPRDLIFIQLDKKLGNRFLFHRGRPGKVMWDLRWTKMHCGRFFPSTSVSLANSQSTDCSTFIIIYNPGMV